MTVTRLATVEGVGPGQADELGRGRPLPCPTWPAGAPLQLPWWSHPLLNVAGSGGRGLAAHAGGVHGLGGDEVQVLIVRDLV